MLFMHNKFFFPVAAEAYSFLNDSGQWDDTFDPSQNVMLEAAELFDEAFPMPFVYDNGNNSQQHSQTFDLGTQ